MLTVNSASSAKTLGVFGVRYIGDDPVVYVRMRGDTATNVIGIYVKPEDARRVAVELLKVADQCSE